MNKRIENISTVIGFVALMLVVTAFISFMVVLLTGDSISYEQMFLATRIAVFISTILTIWFYSILFKIKWQNILTNNGGLKFNTKRVLIFSVTFLSILIYLTWSQKFNMRNSVFFIGFLLTAVSEEVIFRGLVEFHLGREFSICVTIILQAIIFAFMGHQGLEAISNLIIRAPLGVLLSLLKRYTGSYGVTAVSHFLYDSAAFIL